MAAGIVIVPSLFNGPPDSAHGGYLAGVLAGRIAPPGTAVAVTLRSRPPLEKPMRLIATDDGARLLLGDVLVAEAVETAMDGVEPPAAVSLETARRAEERYPGNKRHPFPSCFACGPARGGREGMHLYAGPLDGDATATACSWIPDPSLALLDGGQVRPEFVWAALDCPGAWTIALEDRAVVLGRITARVLSAPSPGEPCVVVGRLSWGKGRKFATGTAAYGADGRLLGLAESLWIEVSAHY